MSELVYGVVTENKNVGSGGKRRLFTFLVLEYNFYLITQTRVEITLQIHINKQTVKTMCGSDEPHPYPLRRFNYCNEQVRANEVQRVIVHVMKTHDYQGSILMIKPTRCTNFSNLLFGIKLYMFRTVPLSIIRSFFTVHAAMVYVLTACEQDQHGTS